MDIPGLDIEEQDEPVKEKSAIERVIDPESVFPDPISVRKPQDDLNTVDVDDTDDGTIIDEDGSGDNLFPYLIRKRTGETIKIYRNPFFIGRGEKCDCSIDGNRHIAHEQAYIIQHDNSYYIVDTNSKNKTWVNSVLCTPNQEVPLKYSDTIRMADEQFEFIC